MSRERANNIMKRVVLLSASPRKNGNSDILCQQFIKGAEAAGHSFELITLYEKTIGFCRACYACFKTGKCVLKDDMTGIFQNLGNEIEGIIWGENVWQKGEVRNTKAMEEAYQAGLNI